MSHKMSQYAHQLDRNDFHNALKQISFLILSNIWQWNIKVESIEYVLSIIYGKLLISLWLILSHLYRWSLQIKCNHVKNYFNTLKENNSKYHFEVLIFELFKYINAKYCTLFWHWRIWPSQTVFFLRISDQFTQVKLGSFPFLFVTHLLQLYPCQ